MSLSPEFIVPSPLAGCNGAWDAANSLYYIPDGSLEEDPPLYQYLTVSTSGAITHAVPMNSPNNTRWSFPFVAYDPATQLGYALANEEPPPSANGNVTIVSWDPKTGETMVLDGSKDLLFIAEEPFCIGSSDPRAGPLGALYFVNSCECAEGVRE